MAELFADVPEAISNTLDIAEKCNLELETGILHLPNFDVPEGETPDSYLEKLVWEGIKKKIRNAFAARRSLTGSNMSFIPLRKWNTPLIS